MIVKLIESYLSEVSFILDILYNINETFKLIELIE